MYTEIAFDKGLITELVSEFIKQDFLLSLCIHLTQLSKQRRLQNSQRKFSVYQSSILATVSHSLFSYHLTKHLFNCPTDYEKKSNEGRICVCFRW